MSKLKSRIEHLERKAGSGEDHGPITLLWPHEIEALPPEERKRWENAPQLKWPHELRG